MAFVPGLFNINEPVIFGYPIVYNISLIIPFILTPALGIIIAYAATAMHFMNECVVYIPLDHTASVKRISCNSR